MIEEKKELKDKIDSLSCFSLETYNKLLNHIKTSKEMANSYTDNIFELISKVKKMRPDLRETEIYGFFNIPDNMDNM